MLRHDVMELSVHQSGHGVLVFPDVSGLFRTSFVIQVPKYDLMSEKWVENMTHMSLWGSSVDLSGGCS